MFRNSEGKNIPSVTFHVYQENEWSEITTDELFKGKTVIAFSLPGAFTPTCSSSHLPRYNELFNAFRKRNVDRILCISVNDTFVMNAWQKDQDAKNIIFVPDGNSEFTTKMGMLFDKTDSGFGMRSWRYSMLVRDSIIEKMFIEPDKADDPFEVSDADTMMKYLNPDYKSQESVALFTKPGCPFCAKAKELLKERSIEFEEIILGSDATIVSLKAISGHTSTPQVFIGGRHIGGSEELEQYLKK